MARNPFENAVSKHEKLIASQPVGRTALMNSLQRLRETGSQLVSDQNMGMVNYANQMHGIFTQAVDLEVKPPLSDGQRAVIDQDINNMDAIISVNTPGEGGQPTDIDTIDTSKKKS